MRRRTFRPGDDPADFAGAVLRRDLSVAVEGRSITVRRGTTLEEALARLPAGSGRPEVSVIVPDAGDIAQPDASLMLAIGIVGSGIEVEPPHQGQVTLRAGGSGLLRVSRAAVARLNRSGVAMVATALDGRVVERGETVAVVKAPVLYVARARVERAIDRARQEPPIRIVPFSARRVAIVAGSRIRPKNLEQASKHLAANLAQFGADLVITRHLANDDVRAIRDVYRALLDAGAEVVLVAGSIVLDPDDPFMVAARGVGGRFVCRGAPIDPGTMFWLAYAGEVPFLGLASCELYGRTSILDLLLPFTLARERVSPGLMAELGYGGLLAETQAARRPPDWGHARADGGRPAVTASGDADA